MAEKSSHSKLLLAVVGVGVVAVIIIVIVNLSDRSRSTEELIGDLATKNPKRMRSAFERLVKQGPRCVPQLVQEYKKSTDFMQKKGIVRAINRMRAPEDRPTVVPALIELLAVEEDPRLRQEIVADLQLHTGRRHLGTENPLGEDADAWRKWWEEQQK